MPDKRDTCMISYATVGALSPSPSPWWPLPSAIAVASLLLFITSMLKTGWVAALLAADVTFTRDQSLHSLWLPCLLGTIANVAYVIAWIAWWPARPLSAVAALVSACAAIICPVSMDGSFQPGLEYWLWSSAPLVLLAAALMPRKTHSQIPSTDISGS